jgi:hypothetical protein
MKIVITENKAFDAIYKYMDSIFPKDIHWRYGFNWDEINNNSEVEDVDENFLIFYTGDWEGEDYTDLVFLYYDIDYYNDTPSSKPFKDKAPILEVIDDYTDELYDMFGEYWKKPMKKWFEDRFNLPVKTITT